jgi:hypothetical protein
MTAETKSAEEPAGSRGAEGGVPRSGRTMRAGQGIEADTIHGATPSAKLLRSAALRCLARVHASERLSIVLAGPRPCRQDWQGPSATRVRAGRCKKLDWAARLSAVMDGLHRGVDR